MSEAADGPNAEQVEYWNDVAGPTWSRMQDRLDRQLEPLGREAARVLAPRPGERVLDIGCGCGQTTVELAAMVGEGGAVVGVDISRPMLEVARARPTPAGAAKVAFKEADAQSRDLGGGEFDAAFSRFGVMFFSDPVAAFVNIHKALKPAGRLTFVCWRPLAENPWMREPFEAAAPLLPPRPPMDPHAPGPYAFADPDRVRGILTDAGFTAVALTPFGAPIGGADLDGALDLAFRVGPLGAALRENPDRAPAVTEAVKAVLERHLTPEGVVLMSAAVWIVTARAG